jgi:hypothetical protein
VERGAIGARIAVTVEDAAGRIVDVQIWWPTSNSRQRFADVAKNPTLRIEEFATTYTRLARPPLRLGGPKTHERAQTQTP